MSNLTHVGGSLEIFYNKDLVDFSGLESLTFLGNDLIIGGCDNLENMDGLNNLQNVSGDLRITNNTSLLRICNLDTVSGDIYIYKNLYLQNFNNFSNLNACNDLFISDNSSLLNMQGFNSLTTVTNLITINNNYNLSSLSGLENLTTSGSLDISSNNLLTDIEAISNMNFSTLTSLGIRWNDILSVCSYPNICQYLNDGNYSQIYQNADGCVDAQEILDNCSISNNIIYGVLRYDMDSNGCTAMDEEIANTMVITVIGSNIYAGYTNENGEYTIFVDPGEYNTRVALNDLFNSSPENHTSTFVGIGNEDEVDFCIFSTITANDLSVNLVPINTARPGIETRYKLVYENVGTTQLNGNVELDFDGALVTFVEATPTETSINGNTISWDYSNLNPFETRSIEVIFEVAQPPIVESGDVLPYIARVNPISGDAAPDDNIFNLNQIAVNSFDPNDKQVLEGYQVLIEDADEYLHYVVRFQNMGTASAIHVRVQDALDEKLDWTTLKVLDASHAMETQLVNGSIDFIFDDINLPTEASDPEGSKGFVAFKIKPQPTIQLDDVVANAADIYFDFNAAIVTNTVYTRFVDVLGVSDFEALKVVAYPNPANDILNIQAEAPISSIEIMNILGQTLLTSKGKSDREQIDISGLSAGNYFVKVIIGDESKVLRVVKF